MTSPSLDLLEAAVPADAAGDRLDRFLPRQFPEVSRARFQTLIANGCVTVEGMPVTETRRKVKAGEHVLVRLPPAVAAEPLPEFIDLDIIYEDDALIVIDKPAGLVVHPAAGNWTGTLVNALIAHCGESLSGIGGVRRPGIVHRLDKETSGLMVVAKTDAAHRALAAQFTDHGRAGPLERGYLAFVWGAPDRPKGRIEANIARHPHARDKMAVREAGRPAITEWATKERYFAAGPEPVAALLACRLATGRTHQIRVHLAHIGHPLLGDRVYGPGFKTKAALLGPAARQALANLDRQALHAHILSFEHPKTRLFLQFRSELPVELA